VFIHQSLWQRRMLARYGSIVTVLDATYNTTAYGLPLFVVSVPTNCGYVTAAVFLASDEKASTIEEGLRIISQWCPEWQTKAVMSDFSAAQIAAVEAVFPGVCSV